MSASPQYQHHKGNNQNYQLPFSVFRAIIFRKVSLVRFFQLGLLISLSATVLAPAKSVGSDEKFQYFSITTDPDDYPRPEVALSALVQRDGRASLNHFCVVGIRDSGNVVAKVFWLENNTITLWWPGGQYDRQSLLTSNRVWNLKKDVVPTNQDVGSSTYLISQTEVDEQRSACEKTGNKFIVRKKARREKQK